MTHAMIWTFGILAFILLMTVIGKWGNKGSWGRPDGRIPRRYFDSVESGNAKLDEMAKQLGEISRLLAEVDPRAKTLERILQEVQ